MHNKKTFLIHRQIRNFRYFIIMLCSKIKVIHYQIYFFKLYPILKMLKFITVQQSHHHLFNYLYFVLLSIFQFSFIILSVLFFPFPWLAFQQQVIHLDHAMAVILCYLSKLSLLILFIFLLQLLPPYDCHLYQLNHQDLSPLRDDIHSVYQAVLKAIQEVYPHLKLFQLRDLYSCQLACKYQIVHPILDLQITLLPLEYQEWFVGLLLNCQHAALTKMMAQGHIHFYLILKN